MFKRGISPVVATMLLIVITVVIASIIMAFVLPFVRDKLGESEACLDVFDGIEFGDSKFNCWDDNGTPAPADDETGFSVKINKESIKGFRISLIDESDNSNVYDISAGKMINNVRMIGSGSSGYNTALIFPETGGQRSYVSNSKYVRAEISATTNNNQVCSVADVIELRRCETSLT